MRSVSVTTPPTLSGLVGVAIIVLVTLLVGAWLCRRTPIVSFGEFSGVVMLHLTVGIARYLAVGTGNNDAAAYHYLGIDAAHALASGTTFSYVTGKDGWPEFIGYIYLIFGVDPLPVIATASAGIPLTAWTIGQVTILTAPPGRSGNELDRRNYRARLAFRIVAYWPGFMVWGDTMLRESVCWTLAAMALLGWLRLRERRLAGVLLLAIGLAGLASVRGTLAVLVASGIVIAATLLVAVHHRGLRPIVVLVIIAALIVVPAVIAQIAGVFNLDLDFVNRSRAELASTASSSFGSVGAYSSASDVVMGTVLNLPRALAGPFPWEWSLTASGLLTAADALVWCAVLAILFRQRRMLNKQQLTTFLVPALSVLLPLAASSGNYGTMVRLRTISLVMIVPLIATAISSRKTRSNSTQSRPRQGSSDTPERPIPTS